MYVGIVDQSISVDVPATTTLKVEVTADACVDAGAEIRLAYTLNNTFPAEGSFGPANFALITVGPGRAVIRPVVRVNGPTGKTGFLLRRCVSVEASTS